MISKGVVAERTRLDSLGKAFDIRLDDAARRAA